MVKMFYIEIVFFFNWFSRLLKNYSVKFKRLMMVCYSFKYVNYNAIESSLGNEDTKKNQIAYL